MAHRSAAGLAFSIASLLAAAEPPFGGGNAAFYLDASSIRGRILAGGEGASRLGLRLEADEAGADLRGLLSLRSADGSSAFMAGPGAAAGPARLLADPTAFGQGFSLGPPASLDPSLESASSVLSCEAGPAAFFALGRGFRPGLLVERPGFGPAAASAAGTGAGPAARPAGEGEARSAAAGLALGSRGGGGGWALLGACSLRRASAGGDGWKPEPPPEREGIVLASALAGERRWVQGRSSGGLALSWDPGAGPGLAARLESEAHGGPFSLRLAAGASAEGFRRLMGDKPARSLGFACDLRIALPGSALLSTAYRLESPRAGPGEPPRLERGLSLLAALPLLAARAPEEIEARLDLGGDEELSGDSRLGLALKRGGAGGAPAWRLGAAICLRGRGSAAGPGPGPLEAGFSARSGRLSPASGRPVPEFLAEFAVQAFQGGHPGDAVRAKGSLGLVLPLEEAASLGIEAALPSEGLELRPARPSEPGRSPVLSLSYLCRFGS